MAGKSRLSREVIVTKERNKHMENMNEIFNGIANAATLYYYYKNKIQRDLVNTDEEYIMLDEAEKDYRKALIDAIRCFADELSALQD